MKILANFYSVVRRDPFLIVCAAFVVGVVLLAWIGIHFTGYTYDQISDASLQMPSRTHWFGTDVNGHDLLTRTLYGAQISLLVAGTGKRNGLPASAMTRFLGTVHAMRELTEAADIFLLPTIYDPFSNASLEAMAAGLPVITTEGNGFAEVMRTGMDGEVLRSAADIAGIAGGIDKWRGRETPETRAYRRAEARRYTMERNAQETLEALARISAR